MVLDQFLILKESSLDNILETVYTLIGSTVLCIESKRTTVELNCFVAIDFLPALVALQHWAHSGYAESYVCMLARKGRFCFCIR